MKILMTLIFSLMASLAAAQSLPERYSVTGVAEDDVLNIRSGPGASFDKVGEFGPFTLNVEVMRVEDGWGYVPAGEVSGWVSMRYLMPNPLPAFEVPRPMACYGTEPFWSLSLYPRGIEFDSPMTGPRTLNSLRESAADDGFFVMTEEGPTLNRTLIVKAMACNDGMSDRDFGMSALLYNEAPDGNSVLQGCCTFQVN